MPAVIGSAEPWVVPIEIVEATHPTAVVVVIVHIIFHLRAGIDSERIGHVFSTGMEFNDVIAQRVGAYLLEIAAELAAPVILVIAAVAPTVISGCIVFNFWCALHCLITLLRGEIQVVLRHHRDWQCTKED